MCQIGYYEHWTMFDETMAPQIWRVLINTLYAQKSVDLGNLPAEDTKDKVKYKERPDDDETDEVNPRPPITVNVIDLSTHNRIKSERVKNTNYIHCVPKENFLITNAPFTRYLV